MRQRSLVLTSLLVACSAAAPPPAHTRELALELYPQRADVWAFDVALQGRLVVPAGRAAELVRCEVERQGLGRGSQPVQRFPAQVSGRELSLRMPLPPEQESAARARCRDRAGRELVSADVRLTSKLSSAPTAEAEVRVQGEQLTLDGAASSANAGTRAPLLEYTWWRVLPGAQPETPLGTGPQLTLAVPTEQGELQFVLRVRDASGKEALAKTAVVVTPEGARPLAPKGPRWIDEAVVYGVIPPLYGQPPLARVTDSLDALKTLGIDALWLSPIFATPPDDFGYAVTDYFEVRRDYGDTAALETLLHEAHARGLRVLLDMVINHSSAQHRYYQEAEALGPRSHYYGFYQRDASGSATHYFDWLNLPNFDFDNPEVAAWATAFSAHWVALGIDGYRVDAAWGVRQRSPSFYPAWTRALRRLNPDLLLLAEASARDPYYLQHGFDAAYDWTSELGHHAWEGVFVAERGIARRLAEQLAQTAASAPRPERTLRFLNNNDTGKRFVTRHGLELTKVASVALLTLPGIPCLYTFDELGGEFEPYEESAPTLRDGAVLGALYRKLIALRKSTPALRGAGYATLHVGSDDELLAYLRTGSRAEEVAVVVLSFGNAPVTRTLELPAAVRAAFGQRARDALSGEIVALHQGRLEVQLAGFGARVFVPAPPLAPAQRAALRR